MDITITIVTQRVRSQRSSWICEEKQNKREMAIIELPFGTKDCVLEVILYNKPMSCKSVSRDNITPHNRCQLIQTIINSHHDHSAGPCTPLLQDLYDCGVVH